MDNGNQLSRYGAIAKFLPFVSGKTFFLVSATETALGEFLEKYAPDGAGTIRVYTTWASVITACQASTDADVIVVSPLFTTAPTLAQSLLLDAAGVVTIQAGSNLPDGSYVAATAVKTLPASTTQNLFQVNGRIELLNILGEVTTVFQTQANNFKFISAGTVGAAVDLCAVTNVTAAAVGSQLSITGTLATALVVTPASALVRQAAPLVITAGIIQGSTSATSTGAAKYRIHYKPLDAGAFVSPL